MNISLAARGRNPLMRRRTQVRCATEASTVGHLLSGFRATVFSAMDNVEPIVIWRARRRAHADVPCGSPPFVLEESCPGCGQRRIAEIVWRDAPGSQRGLFPRIEPHFLCQAGRVVYQDITDAPLAPTDWSTILGHFEETPDRPASSPSAS